MIKALLYYNNSLFTEFIADRMQNKLFDNKLTTTIYFDNIISIPDLRNKTFKLEYKVDDKTIHIFQNVKFKHFYIQPPLEPYISLVELAFDVDK